MNVLNIISAALPLVLAVFGVSLVMNWMGKALESFEPPEPGCLHPGEMTLNKPVGKFTFGLCLILFVFAGFGLFASDHGINFLSLVIAPVAFWGGLLTAFELSPSSAIRWDDTGVSGPHYSKNPFKRFTRIRIKWTDITDWQFVNITEYIILSKNGLRIRWSWAHLNFENFEACLKDKCPDIPSPGKPEFKMKW